MSYWNITTTLDNVRPDWFRRGTALIIFPVFALFLFLLTIGGIVLEILSGIKEFGVTLYEYFRQVW